MADLGSALASIVIFLFAGSGDEPIGTAFVVGYPMPGKEGLFAPIIVTAKHVIGDHKVVYGRFSTPEGKSTVTVKYDLTAAKAAGDYWEHEDPGVDIVMFRTVHFKATEYSVLPIDLIASQQIFADELIGVSDRVLWPGLLVNFMGTSRNYPVVRNGHIALVPEEQVPLKFPVGQKIIETKQEVIFVDGLAVQGASGSPVFIFPGPRAKGNVFNVGGTKLYLIGVLHGFYNASPREVQEVEVTRTARVFQENSGVALVFPAWRLREILDYPAVKSRIEVLSKQ